MMMELAKINEMKAWIANGGDITIVKQKYQLTETQLKQLTEL